MAEKKFDPDAYLNKTTATPQPKSTSGGFNPDAYLASQKPVEEPGMLSKFGKKAVDTVVEVGNFVDSYTGAPTRAAIGALQNDESPLSAYVKQFGKDPRTAPTGKQIATKAGFSTEEIFNIPLGRLTSGGMSDKGLLDDVKVSPAGVAGVGVDFVADPTNIIPVGLVARGIGKVGGAAAKGTVYGSAMAADAVLGTKGITKTVRGIDIAARQTADKVAQIFGNVADVKRADDFEKQLEIAQKFNIPKELVGEGHEFGLDKSIARLARVRMAKVGGDKYLAKFVEGLDATDNALDQTIAKIGNGSILDTFQAGEVLQDGFVKAERAVFDAADTTYAKLARKHYAIPIQSMPKNKLITEIEDLMIDADVSLRKAIPGTTQKKAAQSVLKTGENIINSTDTLDDYYDTMKRVGDVAFPKNYQDALKTTADQKNLKDLYYKMRSAFEETIKAIDPAEARKLQESNAILSNFLKETEKIRPILKDGSKSPERVFQDLIVNSDLKTLESLKKIIPAEEFKQSAGAYLRSIVPTGEGVQYNSLNQALKKNSQRLSRLLDVEEAQDVADLTSFGMRFGNRISKNVEATGASNMFTNLADRVQSWFVDDLALEGLKARARGQLLDIPASKVKGFSAPISDPTRGYVFRKGAQTYSTQNQNEGK